jgi:uncharacterized protein (TIGR02145 family)
MTTRLRNHITVNVYKIVIALCILCTIYSCKKYNLERTNPRDINAENYRPHVPTLSTSSPTNISINSAEIGGSVSFDGNSKITSRGICYGLNLFPSINDSKATVTSTVYADGGYVMLLSGLTPCTIYHARAYATNSVGTAYGNDIQFKTNCEIITDLDGNVYNTLRIGTQIWMKENLKTTKYNDGTGIPLVTDNTAWSNLTTPGYCWFNNDVGFKATYGALYNWYVVSTGKLCPSGWHVPTDAEWTTLTTYLGGESVAGGKLKEAGLAHWTSPNTGATNEAGFTALPGGSRFFDGVFTSIGDIGWWWSSIEATVNAWCRGMSNFESQVTKTTYHKRDGFSVRCLWGD